MKYILPCLLVIILAASITSCQKELDPTGSTPTDTTVVTPPSQLDLLLDSVYLYTKEVYFWHEVIPPYAQFNPRQYTGSTDLEAAQNEMAAIRALQTEDNRHSYSFVTTKAESDGLQTGDTKDWGFTVRGAYVDEAEPYDSVRWFVTYVYKNSSAGIANVKRGWYINKINNTVLGNDDASISLLNDVFSYNTVTSATFEFVKQDGTVQTNDLTTTDFTANSVLYNKVLTSTDGNKKVGYVVFNQFLGEPSVNELDTAFNTFQSAGINELVVDLRYNHGGSTATQNALANLIAPSSANGKKMYNYVFNDSLKADKFPLLKTKYGYDNGSFTEANNTINFSNAGGLNLTRVFFIVSGQTASASELLINNLRPYLDVKLIGDTTYGKPVGFFPIDIFDYAIYPISFKTVNSVGTADYYDGFAPDKLSTDGVNRDWGDTQEPCLYYALKYITTGTFRMATTLQESRTAALMRAQKQLDPIVEKLNSRKFTGMFIEKKK